MCTYIDADEMLVSNVLLSLKFVPWFELLLSSTEGMPSSAWGLLLWLSLLPYSFILLFHLL